MRPILEKIEASIDANLMGPREAGTRFSEFDFDALLRTDFKTRLESYRIGVQGSIFTPNECRKEEGLPPVQGGDQLYLQGATVPLTMAGQQQTRTELAPNAIQDTTN